MRIIDIAKAVMRIAEVRPSFDPKQVGELSEVFGHPEFLSADSARRLEIMFRSSASKYENEFKFPFDKYFGFDLLPQIKGKEVLDVGCFTGGRSAAWFERYKLARIAGTDVNPVFIEAARQFSKGKHIEADFQLGSGERLPFPDASFDAVLTFDVLEHVQDVAATMRECHRVLRSGGRVFLVFPTYLQPPEHHLGLVTRVPALQYLFSGKTLVRAYFEIIEERGLDAHWYRRESPALYPHERGHTINGTSFREFKRIVAEGGWSVDFVSRAVIGSIGRTVERTAWIRAASQVLRPFAFVPFLEEIFLHRVTMIIRKQP